MRLFNYKKEKAQYYCLIFSESQFACGQACSMKTDELCSAFAWKSADECSHYHHATYIPTADREGGDLVKEVMMRASNYQ